MKKIFLIMIISLLTACGYEPIYINKDDLIMNISSIKKIGDESVNRKILPLIGVKENDQIKTLYELVINSTKKREIATKNSKGNPASFKISLNINISIIDKTNNSKIIKSKKFNSSFTYNSNDDDKFQLSQDEKNIENNLIESVSEKIIIYLNS